MNKEEENLIDTAIDTLQTRDDAYCSKIKGLNLQEQNIYEWYKANPKSTDQEIAEMSGVKLASVNGRRNSLVEKGMLKPTDKKYCEDTECWRTTYMITDGTEARTPKTFLTSTEFEGMKRMARKLKSTANHFQIKQINEILNQ